MRTIRIIFLFLLLMAATIIPSCSHQNNQMSQNELVRWNQSFGATNDQLCADDQTVFFLTNSKDGKNLLMYADLESGVGGPLCGKAECMHDDYSCNAYVGNTIAGLIALEDELRWVGFDISDSGAETGGLYLFSMKQDGTGRQKIRKLTDDISIPLLTGKIQYSKTYLFLCTEQPEITNGQELHRHTLTAYGLDSQHEDAVIFEESVESARYSQCFISADEDTLALMFCQNSSEGTTLVDISVHRYDIGKLTETGAPIELYEFQETPLQFTYSRQQLFVGTINAADAPGHTYRVFDDGNIKACGDGNCYLIAAGKAFTTKASSGKYRDHRTMNLAMVELESEEALEKEYLLDELYERNRENADRMLGITYSGADERYLYIRYRAISPVECNDEYIAVFGFDTDDARILWRREEMLDLFYSQMVKARHIL